MKILRIALLALTSFVSTSTMAQQSTDISDFQISGVHLGMSANEAMDALAAHYSINKDDFEITRNAESMPLTEYVGSVDRIQYGRSMVDDLTISIGFDPDLEREDAGYMVVSELDIFDERINFQDKLESAVSENGPYSSIFKGDHEDDTDRWVYLWCSENSGKKDCNSFNFNLQVTGFKVSLQTSFFWDTFEAEWDKAKEQGYRYDPNAGRDTAKMTAATSADAGGEGSQGDNPGEVPEPVLEDVGSLEVIYFWEAGGHKIFAGNAEDSSAASGSSDALHNYVNIDFSCMRPGGSMEVFPKASEGNPKAEPFAGTFMWQDIDSHKESDSMELSLTGQALSKNPDTKRSISLDNIIYGSIVLGKSTIGNLPVTRIVKYKSC